VATQFSLGQTSINGTLIFTTSAPPNEEGVWFYDSVGNYAPLADLPRFHPSSECFLPPWFEDVARTREPRLLLHACCRWRSQSIKASHEGRSSSNSQPLLPLRTFLRDFYAAPNDAYYDLLAVFVVATYVYTLSPTMPYLLVIGEPATGKTVLGTALQALSFNGMQASSISSASIFRFLEKSPGTMIFDEQVSGTGEWMNILLAGNRTNGAVYRCDHEHSLPVAYPCYCPKVLIANEVPANAALLSRTIPLRSQPSTKSVQRLSQRALDLRVPPIRDELHAFAMQHAANIARELETASEDPDFAHRDFDLAAPLLAIARVLDRYSPAELSIEGSLRQFLKHIATERARNHHIDGVGPNLARSLLEFHHDTQEPNRRTASIVREGHEYVLAENLTNYLRSKALIPLRWKTKQLSEALSRHSLILDRRIVDIQKPNPGDLANPRRVQRTALRLDLSFAQRLAGEVR
jgi:hypothetical protein